MKKKMMIKIKKNAGKNYCKKVNYSAIIPKWYRMLKAIEEKTIEVETEYLFNDQFNTVPIPGISEQGMRIMGDSVETVINDKRIGYMRCYYCSKSNPINETCPSCGLSAYLEPFKVNQAV